MTALARPGASQLPPKIAIHPRPVDSFVHAMPAHLRGATVADDLVGMKWVAGLRDEQRARHRLHQRDRRAQRSGDRRAGRDARRRPDHGPANGRDQRPGDPALRAGRGCRRDVQRKPRRNASPGGRHRGRGTGQVAPPGARRRPAGEYRRTVFDTAPERAAGLAEAARATPGIAAAEVHATAREAVEAAEVVVTAASFGPAEDRQVMTNAWLQPNATVVPIDYATYCAAEVARDAALFLVDQREQFLANRDVGNFDGYPDPMATIGEAILAGTPRPAGRVVVTHLGVGLADLVFADAIVRAAIAAGRGTTLSR